MISKYEVENEQLIAGRIKYILKQGNNLDLSHTWLLARG